MQQKKRRSKRRNGQFNGNLKGGAEKPQEGTLSRTLLQFGIGK